MSMVGTQPFAGGTTLTRLRVLRLALVVLTALATVLILFTSPIDTQEGEFLHALRSGEITSLAVGHSGDFRSDTGFSSISYDATDDIAVSWVNRFGIRRAAVLNELQSQGRLVTGGSGAQPLPPASSSDVPPAGPSDVAPDTQSDLPLDSPTTAALDASASIAATARSLGVPAPTIVRPGELPLDHFFWLPTVVPMLMVVLMLFGPQPRRTTKWGAFWAYTAPLNIGIFWALLRDSPWNQDMNRLPAPMPGDLVAVNLTTDRSFVRLGGWTMFFLAAFIVRFALGLALLAIIWAMPEYVDPVRWTVVDLAGTWLTIP
jgi:hypothetical protein